jgi:hypothetical protein
MHDLDTQSLSKFEYRKTFSNYQNSNNIIVEGIIFLYLLDINKTWCHDHGALLIVGEEQLKIYKVPNKFMLISLLSLY